MFGNSKQVARDIYSIPRLNCKIDEINKTILVLQEEIDVLQGNIRLKHVVENYNELLTVTDQTLYEFAQVLNDQGTKWLPGSLGGTYYGSGLYYWNGTKWVHDDAKVYEALSGILGNLDDKLDKGTYLGTAQTLKNEIDALETELGDYYTKSESDLVYEKLLNKGVANGYTPLGSDVRIPMQYIPDGILGQVHYGGTYDGLTVTASANYPELQGEPLPLAEDYPNTYFISSGNYTNGSFNYLTGDWIISTGEGWTKIDNTDAVTTVFGRIGPIVALESDYEAFYSKLGHTHTFASLTSKPTTIGGYGITDAYTKNEADGKYLLRTSDTLTGVLTVNNANTWGNIVSRTGLADNNAVHGGLTFASDRSDRYSGIFGFRYGTSTDIGLRFYVSDASGVQNYLELSNGGNLIFNRASGNNGIFRGNDSNRFLIGGGSTWSQANGAYLSIEGEDYGGVGAGGNVTVTLGPTGKFSTNRTIEALGGVSDIIANGILRSRGGGGVGVRIGGTSTGASNISYAAFYESDGSTRQGYIGFPSASNDDLILRNDRHSNHLILRSGLNGLLYDGGDGVSRIVWHSGNLNSNAQNDTRYFTKANGSGGDANDAIVDGAYNGRPFSANHPGGASHGRMLVFGQQYSGLSQIFIDDQGGTFFRGQNYLGVWGDWYQAWTTRNDSVLFKENTNNTQVSGDFKLNNDRNLFFGTSATPQGRMFSNGIGLYLDLGGDFIIRDRSPVVNRFTFGRSTGNFTATGNITANSDKRLKKFIKPILHPLNKIGTLNGCTWIRKDTGQVQTGLIAQDLIKVLPEAIEIADDKRKTLSIAYGNVVGLLVEGIKELKEIVEKQQKEIDGLRTIIS